MTSETVAAEFGNSPEPAGAQSAGTQPGAPTGSLRAWQRRALTKYLSSSPRDFLAVATPGAGKTTFALRVASELLRDRTVDQITVVAPTEHLKHQWAESAQRSGLALDSRFSNSTGQTSSDYHGVVLTYAQVASHPSKHRVRTEGRKTLVILDEIHHGGDAKSWGDAIREAFGDATRRLALTGTPFRSDDSAFLLSSTSRTRKVCSARKPTTPTDIRMPSRTAWFAPSCFSPTRARHGGETTPARNSPLDSASR